MVTSMPPISVRPMPAMELVELDFKLAVDPALDMALEQPSEPGRGKPERGKDGDCGGEEQSDAERPEAHACAPGTA